MKHIIAPVKKSKAQVSRDGNNSACENLRRFKSDLESSELLSTPLNLSSSSKNCDLRDGLFLFYLMNILLLIEMLIILKRLPRLPRNVAAIIHT